MKSYGKLIIGAIVIGAFFAYLFFKDINKEVMALEKNSQNIYLFQVGVFKNLDNANNYAKNFPSKIIYQTADYYRVVTCLTTMENNKNKLKEYYNVKNIDYYLKKVEGSPEFNQKLEKYEELLSKTTKEEVINNLCQSMLNDFLTYS